ncbi:MAG: ABC transporter ATP-binding protein [Nitrososphaerales archaeon]
MPIIKVEALRKVYVQTISSAKVVAIDNLTFNINEHEVVSIVGQTGCGKSTFLNILMGLEQPTSGKLEVDGKEPYKDFNSLKGKIGIVFQQDRLLPWRRAIDNTKIGLEVLGYTPEEQIKRASEWLTRLGLANFLNAYPSELSGGMRQRVALARALCIDPKIILLDEAFGHLDEVTASKLRKDFLELVHSTKKTAVFVTHQLDEAIEIGNRIIVFGKPAKVLADIKVEPSFKDDQSKIQRLRQEIQQILDKNQPIGLE